MKVEDLIRLLEFCERYDMMEEGKALLKSILPNGEGEKVEPCFAKEEPTKDESEPNETKQELYDKAYAEGYEKAKLEFEEEKKKIQRESYKEGYNNAFHSRDKFMLIYEDNNP